jgi:hypothetical protein
MYKYSLKLIALVVSLSIAGCGGGGGGGGDPVSAAAPTPTSPTTPTTPTTPTGSTIPKLSANPILLSRGQTLGTDWPEVIPTTGPQGEPVGAISCTNSLDSDLNSHLSIFRNGERLAIPAGIGITPNCHYEIHTHDFNGVLHLEGPAPERYTLGQFFQLWGQPLSRTNVAGLSGLPVVVYINDGGNVSEYSGDLADIELVNFRSITIQVGSPLTELPTYTWAPDI